MKAGSASSFLIILAAQIHFSKHIYGFSTTRNENNDAEVFHVPTKLSNASLPDEAYRPKIESIHITSKIRFRYARTRIISAILNPHPYKSQEVNFTMRLPKDAFISSFEMKIDNSLRRYKANVTRREDANKLFEMAKDSKSISLGLIEQTDSLDFDEFTLKFVVGKGKKITLRVIYEERLPRILDGYESIIHLVPEEKVSSKTIFKIEIIIDENLPVGNITVPTSELYSAKPVNITRYSPKKVMIGWTNFKTESGMSQIPKEDFVVSFSLQSSENFVLLRNGYFVHFFAPPDLELLRKHVIFIVDISDSMTGIKMNQTVTALTDILDELGPNDFINILTFSSNVEIWSCYKGSQNSFDSVGLRPFPADDKCKEAAISFMEKQVPNSSTDMLIALETGLEIARNVSSIHSPSPTAKSTYQKRRNHKYSNKPKLDKLPENVQSLIIFFTDGKPSSGEVDKSVILTRVKILNLPLEIPIFSLAFGESADFEFLTRLSTRNWAFARKIYEKADTNLQLVNFYREIASPTLANLTFRYEVEKGVYFNNITTSGYSMHVKGSEIISVGRLQRTQLNHTRHNNMQATISGVGRNGPMVFNVPIIDCEENDSCYDESETDNKCLEKLFVYLTIKRLLQEELNLSIDEEYENNNQTKRLMQEDINEYKEEVTKMAIQNGFVTRHTSMVMRTRSILEEEMDGDSTVDPNSEWELVVVNDPPASSSKPMKQRIEKTAIKERPIATGFKLLLPRVPNTITNIQEQLNYRNFEIENASNTSIIETNQLTFNSTAISFSNNSQTTNVTFNSTPISSTTFRPLTVNVTKLLIPYKKSPFEYSYF